MPKSAGLTAMAVAKMAKPGRYGDGGGLYLQVSRTGTKAWLFRFTRDGQARQMGLGPVHTIGLAEARTRATDCRRALLDGIDPIESRRAARLEARRAARRVLTFKECADRHIAAQEAGWRNVKHRAQWTSTLEAYAYPKLGGLAVDAIDTALVVDVLEPIWTAKPETAGRVRGRVEAVLNWAAARGYRESENPARWRGHLDKLLPSRRKVRSVKNHPALPYAELPAFMADLRDRPSVSAKALEFTILTAARTGETIGAKWPEIDFKAAMWIVPAERMKAGKEHRVPLSRRAVELLESLPREGEFVFMGGKAGKPLSNMALLELMRGMRPGFVPHGFRSTFRDWASESTAFPSEVVEMALAHVIENKVEAAYRRGDLFEKRRRLMADWASYCESSGRTGDVVPMREARRG